MDVLPEVPMDDLIDAFWDARINDDVLGQLALWNIIRARDPWMSQRVLIDVMLGFELDYARLKLNTEVTP